MRACRAGARLSVMQAQLAVRFWATMTTGVARYIGGISWWNTLANALITGKGPFRHELGRVSAAEQRLDRDLGNY